VVHVVFDAFFTDGPNCWGIGAGRHFVRATQSHHRGGSGSISMGEVAGRAGTAGLLLCTVVLRRACGDGFSVEGTRGVGTASGIGRLRSRCIEVTFKVGVRETGDQLLPVKSSRSTTKVRSSSVCPVSAALILVLVPWLARGSLRLGGRQERTMGRKPPVVPWHDSRVPGLGDGEFGQRAIPPATLATSGTICLPMGDPMWAMRSSWPCLDV